MRSPLQSHSLWHHFQDSGILSPNESVFAVMRSMKPIKASLQINMQSSNQSSICVLRREADVCVYVCVCVCVCVTSQDGCSACVSELCEFSDAWLTSDAVLITAQASLNTVCVTRTLSCACQRSHTYRRVHCLSLFSSLYLHSLIYFPICLFIPFYYQNTDSIQTRASHHWVKVHISAAYFHIKYIHGRVIDRT